MAKQFKNVTKIQKEFLPIGTEIARLQYKLYKIGAYETARLLTKATDTFHTDVERIVEQRKKK